MTPGRLEYMRPLDGVRAVAISGVLATHGSIGVDGGFLGVDVFFVLSGFLITALLLTEHNANGHISLRAFYGRRARRLLPALVVLCAGVAVVYAAFSDVYRGIDYLKSVAAVLSFGGNWVQAYHQHGAGGRLGLFDPAWSLGIEEQFYLVWPLALVLFIRRRASARAVLASLVVGAILSATLRALTWWQIIPGSAFFGTHARADGLLLGCALAILWNRAESHQWLQRWFSRNAVAFAIAATFALAAWRLSVFGSGTYAFGIAAVNLATFALLAHLVVGSHGVAHRLLGSTPAVWLGARSYGVYLYHWPLFAVLSAEHLHTGASDLELFPLRVAAALVVAAISYRFVERPFLRRRGASLRRIESKPAPAGQA